MNLPMYRFLPNLVTDSRASLTGVLYESYDTDDVQSRWAKAFRTGYARAGAVLRHHQENPVRRSGTQTDGCPSRRCSILPFGEPSSICGTKAQVLRGGAVLGQRDGRARVDFFIHQCL